MFLCRLYRDIEAILANLLLDKRNEDRETGYGGVCIYIYICVCVCVFVYYIISLYVIIHHVYYYSCCLFYQL